jgi:hypothetical protein
MKRIGSIYEKSMKTLFLLVMLVAAVSIRSAWCDSTPSISYDREDLYREGHEAYKNGDFVTALKDLFAFEILNEKHFQAGTSDELKKLRSALDQAVKRSESELRKERTYRYGEDKNG